METARDLACAELWQASLERSLARRGRPARSSLALYHLRPERDLAYGDFVRESAAYSQLRRSAPRRPAMSLPSAGGITALALLAATTLPGLLGGRGGASRRERITYRADASAEPPKAAAAKSAAASPTGDQATTLAGPASQPHSSIAWAAPRSLAHATSRTPSSTHIARSSPVTTARAHIAVAHVGSVAHSVSGGAARAVSGGAAPTTPQHSASAPRVPAIPQPSGHPSTGGTAEQRSAGSAIHPVVRLHPRTATSAHRKPTPRTQPKPVTRTQPKPITRTHSRTVSRIHTGTRSRPHPKVPTNAQAIAVPIARAHPHPVSHAHPVATTRPAPAAKPAPAAPIASGRYVNPLAGASVTPERIDQGVDYSGSGPLGAIGDGRITYVATTGTGWPGAFIEYQLTDGPDAGRYVYYAEGVSPTPGLHVGESVQAGQPIAQIIPGSSSGIEIGWGAGIGTETYAMQHGQWSGGDDDDSVPSPAGKDFSALIAELGGPPGEVEG